MPIIRIRNFLTLMSLFTANMFGRFLGSEGTAIMMSGRNLVLMGIGLFVISFTFGLLRLPLRKKYGCSPKVLFLVNLSFGFLISFYFSFVRFYIGCTLLSFFGSVLVIWCVSSEELISYPGPSGASRSPTWTDFDIGVIQEPWPTDEREVNQPEAEPVPPANPVGQEIVQNRSMESSMRNRILLLEQQHSIFLLDKGRDEYWNEIRVQLDQAHSQGEYNRILEFESRDLQIREWKQKCYAIFQELISANPELAEKTGYNPLEALIDFLNERRDELDNNLLSVAVAERDRLELQLLEEVREDMRTLGPSSTYFRRILGIYD